MARTGTGRPRPTPMNNWVFQRMFGSSDSIPAAKALANAVLGAAGLPLLDRVDEIGAEVALPNAVDLKSPRMDVLLVSGGRMVDLEAQRTPIDVEGRSLFYASSLLASRVPKGDDSSYDSLPQTVVITFLEGWQMFPDPRQLVTTCRLHWETPRGCLPGDDRFVFVVCELDKAAALYNEAESRGGASELLAWLYALGNAHTNRQEVERMMEKIPSMEEFCERYDLAIGDPAAQAAWNQEVQWIMYKNSVRIHAIKEGRAEGMAEGRAEGMAEGVAAAAELLRGQGVDPAVIAQVEELAVQG